MTIEPSDIISDGYVRMYRQRTDIPFIPENILNIETEFHSLARLHAAFTSTVKKEAGLAGEMQFAWNPQFGYITARPEFCGTGLQVSALLHLEGLHLIGDLDPTLNALYGLRMHCSGCCGEGLKNAAHLFRISNASMIGIDERDIVSRTGRILSDLVHQESNARIRLVEEMPRVFEDAISRSIAILRSCRLLSEWEFLDIISPLRIAAELEFLDNFTREEALSLTRPRLNLPQSPFPCSLEEQKEKDRRDAILADKVNRRFKSVRLNARGKDWLT
jgi:protein arginine kinase